MEFASVYYYPLVGGKHFAGIFEGKSVNDDDGEGMEGRKKCTDFSIECILGNTKGMKSDEIGMERNFEFDWMRCTRYKPPKLQRIRKNQGPKKQRRLGRNPRIPFSPEQVAALEDKYKENAYLNNSQVAAMALSLKLSESRIKIWFQNRRARERRDGNETKGNQIQSFLEKTRVGEAAASDQPQDLSASAFKPCR